jgi:DNA-binding PadR family transcriptional regulator
VTLTTTEAAVLGLLRDEPMSGYDLRKHAERGVAYFWAPAKTQIYATLPKLVEAGYLTATKVAQESRPDKVVYELTEAGLAALRSWIAEAPAESGHGRNVLLLKLFFGELSDAATLLPQVRERREEAEQLRADVTDLDEAGKDDPLPFEGFTRRWGFLYAEALLAWTAEVERELERRVSIDVPPSKERTAP